MCIEHQALALSKMSMSFIAMCLGRYVKTNRMCVKSQSHKSSFSSMFAYRHGQPLSEGMVQGKGG